MILLVSLDLITILMTTFNLLLDFDLTPQRIVFSPTDERTSADADIQTTDDNINELQELFMITLSVVESDASAVNISWGTTIGQIADDDRRWKWANVALTSSPLPHQHSSVHWV